MSGSGRVLDKKDPPAICFKIADRASYREGPGGIKIWRVTATRSGCLFYHNPALFSGEPTWCLRHPDDVGDPESLASLRGAVVTIDHVDEIDPSTYRTINIGHVGENVTFDGRLVHGELWIGDAEAQRRILLPKEDPEALVECSPDYVARFEFGEGNFEGQAYTVRQRDIRYNGLALGPLNWGRSGPEVKIQDKDETMIKVMIGGKERVFDKADDAIEALKGALGASEAALEKERAEHAKSKQALKDSKDPKAIKQKVKDRADLFAVVRRVFDEGDEEEAKEVEKLEDEDDLEVKKAVIAKIGVKVPEGASPEWIDGAYASAVAAMGEEEGTTEEVQDSKARKRLADSRGFRHNDGKGKKKDDGPDDGSKVLKDAQDKARKADEKPQWAMTKE